MCTWVVSALLTVCSTAVAQEDVTTQYMINPSFETDEAASLSPVENNADGLRGYTLNQPSGWTISGTDVTKLLVTAACYTDNNFGKVTSLADGNQAYYLRMGWSTGATTIQQVLENLPKGKYKLTADIRSAYANSAASSFRLFAGTASASVPFMQGSADFFVSAPWKTSEVPFEQAEDGQVTVGVTTDWLSGGSCIMIDNVRLYRLADDYVEPEEPTEQDVESFTEGVIDNVFVGETEMKADLLQMLANFATYLKNDFQDCAAPNSVGEVCGCFKGENTMGNNEQGVRPNADLSMICAFLVKYGQGKVTLPAGVTWDDVETMAMKSLVFAYSTHKANKLKVCAGNSYWGSTSTSDHVWESSLWAMSVAYSAFFQWNKLTEAQKGYIEKLLKAECNYELGRTIPTGYAGDTKAEENGWEADILAATLGLFPNDALASYWFKRLREFAINSYSHKDDAENQTVIDPDYDQTTIAQLYKGQNLYDDYTLQNHNYFHTSYQNVVMQELGEAALALKLFQTGLYGEEKWKTNALMHHNQEVQTEVLNWLALADGELAMPNGNDWSLFLYDQITSYTTNACFLRDADALMLENMAYKYIKARQKTTDDGSWLLRADVGARRMGVEAHRVMMTWLMHEVLSTADLAATEWAAFRDRHSEARKIETQNIVRAYTPDRFTTFSWSNGLKSYTGYIASDSPDKNKIIVPFRANNTGNFLGWYTVSGKGTNATPVVNGIYNLKGNAWTMNGELNTNDATLNNRFAIYSTPGNAVIYLDYVRALADVTISKEQGGLMAISTDEMTRQKRTLYYTAGDDSTIPDGVAEPMKHKQSDGSQLVKLETNWVNIDNELGIVARAGKQMAFGDRANNNSVMTSKIYPAYSDQSRTVSTGDVVGQRMVTYYSNISAGKTAELDGCVTDLNSQVPAGWGAVMVHDPDLSLHLLAVNFMSDQKCVLSGLRSSRIGADPVFEVPTTITSTGASIELSIEQNHAAGLSTHFFVNRGSGLFKAFVSKDNSQQMFITAIEGGKIEIGYVADMAQNTGVGSGELTLRTGETLKLTYEGGELRIEEVETFPEEQKEDLTEGYEDITPSVLLNPNFEEDETYGNATGNVTLGSVTYNPCYVNNVAAANAKWPNVLPVQGWTGSNGLQGGSKFCRMYSMPYSLTMYCVSPSNVGNYAAQTGRMIADEGVGERTLTVLNSWDSGTNAITQNASLTAGDYRVLLDMKYECPNQTANNGRVVNTSGGNVNTSLTGVKIGTVTDYRYPSAPNTWEQMVYDFTLDEAKDVTISLGFQTSQSQGAANNTLLYIDNVRILKKVPTGITDETLRHDDRTGMRNGAVYDIQGRRVHPSFLSKGVYVAKGQKFVKK
ncbi:MAG: hypothetical protein IJS97_00290 [Prevotella sp.]|nr:hypothetical protein [Prevotella sp.]